MSWQRAILVRMSEVPPAPPIIRDNSTWHYDAAARVLVHRATGYEVELERFTSSAQILDVIFHVRVKLWADASTMCDLLAWIEELLYPQANYCGGGVDRRPDVLALLTRYPRRRLFP